MAMLLTECKGELAERGSLASTGDLESRLAPEAQIGDKKRAMLGKT